VHGSDGVGSVGEVDERVVLEFLDALDAAAAGVTSPGRVAERSLQRRLGRRQHQVAHVQNAHLRAPHTRRLPYTATMATAPREKLLTGPRPVGNWTQLQFSFSLFRGFSANETAP